MRALPLIGALLAIASGCARMDQDAMPADPHTVKLGLLVAQSGAYGFDQSVALAARLAIDEINQAGGVNGRRLEPRIGNDMSISAAGVIGAQAMVDEGVVGIVGCSSSSVTMEVARQVTIPKGIPLVSPSSTSPSLTTMSDGGTVFRTVPSDAFQGVILAEQMFGQGLKQVGVIFNDNAYGSGLALAFRTRFEALGGRIAGYVPYPDGKAIGFSGEVTSLFALGVPQGVVIIGYLADSANITWDIQQADPMPRPRLFGVDANFDPSFLSNASTLLVEGMEGTAPSPPSPSTDYDRFAQELLTRTGVAPQLYAATAYDAIYLMALAMIEGKANTSLAIRTNLRSVSRPSGLPADVLIRPGEFAKAVTALQAGQRVNYEGASGSVDLDLNGDVTSGAYQWWRVVRGPDGRLRYETQQIIRFP